MEKNMWKKMALENPMALDHPMVFGEFPNLEILFKFNGGLMVFNGV